MKNLSKNIKKEIIEWIKIIAVSLVIALIITHFVRPTLVQGSSMYPTLEEKDYLIINRIAYDHKEPKRGDIIVFKTDLLQDNGKAKDLVKRVIAVPGDHIKITDNKVYINGKLQDEKYIHGAKTEGDIDMTIPKGYVFAMGDNRENSMDSRDPQVGIVKESDIMGKVMVRLLPFNKIGKIS
ncbi:signal peptidase I [Paeniclostridium hominis]|uniref:signal peptidase I n=1 Tax=Paeniclostridium hominis TaxID=2764329 RepID=UPI0038CD4B63